jgi:hypothetical protein
MRLHVYEVRPRKDNRGADLISNVLPFGRLWYGEPNAVTNAIGYAQHYSRSEDAVIRAYVPPEMSSRRTSIMAISASLKRGFDSRRERLRSTSTFTYLKVRPNSDQRRDFFFTSFRSSVCETEKDRNA